MNIVKTGIGKPTILPEVGTNYICPNCRSTLRVTQKDLDPLYGDFLPTVNPNSVPGYSLCCPSCESEVFVPILNLNLSKTDDYHCTNCNTRIINDTPYFLIGKKITTQFRVCGICKPHFLVNGYYLYFGG